MPWLNPLLIIYALLNIGLGIDGYVSKGSLISMIAGVGIGLLMLGTVWLTKTQPRFGRIGSLVLALAVTGQFLPKFIKTGAWLPAGILTIASGIVIIALLAGHLMAMQAKKGATPTAE